MTDEIKNHWVPTAADKIKYMKDRGWPFFDDIKTDHLDSDEERSKLTSAVETVRAFVHDFNEGKRGKALILIANPVDGDMTRTGYGCGKSMLAQIAWRSTGYVQYLVSHNEETKHEPQEMWVQMRGQFYESRKLMSIFDDSDYQSNYYFNASNQIVVIDDLGREGSLKWEKRDLEMQLQEKQDRYYTIINDCYERERSMIITSNLSSREMATFLGGASWSRLLQMCPAKYRVNMTGIKDMRPLLSDNGDF